ncbi:hypothetical protein FA95DRAFT_1565912 [Auriscalpium vulgare]|uniref:Uncharacterized protein n=1 Tax=Auriscalpium vulgare TaxID=40419 RepID=A0ACB8RAZ6_9AGAM|nr:hypothetical protein FA95DRAFT_1565912 [Auriscalpium vulgare]
MANKTKRPKRTVALTKPKRSRIPASLQTNAHASAIVVQLAALQADFGWAAGAQKPEPVPESEWPASDLADSRREITTELARQRYREALQDLTFKEKSSPSHQLHWQQMKLFREADVERLAWRRHGGPAGWRWWLMDHMRKHRIKVDRWVDGGMTDKHPGEFHCPAPLAKHARKASGSVPSVGPGVWAPTTAEMALVKRYEQGLLEK